jgi:hypothetical protein
MTTDEENENWFVKGNDKNQHKSVTRESNPDGNHIRGIIDTMRAVLNRGSRLLFLSQSACRFKNHSYPPFFHFEMTARLANCHN